MINQSSLEPTIPTPTHQNRKQKPGRSTHTLRHADDQFSAAHSGFRGTQDGHALSHTRDRSRSACPTCSPIRHRHPLRRRQSRAPALRPHQRISRIVIKPRCHALLRPAPASLLAWTLVAESAARAPARKRSAASTRDSPSSQTGARARRLHALTFSRSMFTIALGTSHPFPIPMQ